MEMRACMMKNKINIDEYNEWLLSLKDNCPSTLLTEIVEYPELENFCIHYLEQIDV